MGKNHGRASSGMGRLGQVAKSTDRRIGEAMGCLPVAICHSLFAYGSLPGRKVTIRQSWLPGRPPFSKAGSRPTCTTKDLPLPDTPPTARKRGALYLLGDGASWIRTFFTERLADFSHAELILDWYHLLKKCYELSSMFCYGRKAKAALVGRLIFHLWRGQVKAAVAHLETYRASSRNQDKLVLPYIVGLQTKCNNNS